MSVYPIVHCGGTFPGKSAPEPCRAFLPLPRLPLSQGWAIDTDAARNTAWKQGWSYDERTGVDLCPAHTRAHRAEQLMRAAVQLSPVTPEQAAKLLGGTDE